MIRLILFLGSLFINHGLLATVDSEDDSPHITTPSDTTSPPPTFLPTKESWNSFDTIPSVQISNGIDLIYGTLFQKLNFLRKNGFEDYVQEVYDQSLLFRRLYLVMGLGDVQYKGEDGSKGSWPFPLATLFTQGQRVLIILERVSFEEFLDFLTNENPRLFYKRAFSSHGISLETKELSEVKIKTPFRRIKKGERVLGLDFPFGGVGTALPNGSVVGPRGWELTNKVKKNQQIGHLHLYSKHFSELNQTGVLVGIESCAPDTKNQLGCDHNILSGIHNQTLNPSVSGGVKWASLKDLSYAPPVEYGGKVLHLSRERFFAIKKKVEEILSQEDHDQKELFQKVLALDGFRAAGFLWTHNVGEE